MSDQPFAAPSGESLARVKDEIAFFMEKTFQITFGYLGALIALAVASGLDAGTAVAKELGLGTAPLFCTGVLLLNAMYLSLAAGTLFATIKRGLFLITQDPGSLGHRRWESFVRQSDEHSPFGSGPRGFIAWNLDNFYMTPLFAMIGVVSVVIAIIGVREADGVLAHTIVLLAVAAHALPIAALGMTGKLAARAKTTLEKVEAT